MITITKIGNLYQAHSDQLGTLFQHWDKLAVERWVKIHRNRVFVTDSIKVNMTFTSIEPKRYGRVINW